LWQLAYRVFTPHADSFFVFPTARQPLSFSHSFEAGHFPATEYLWDDEPRALPLGWYESGLWPESGAPHPTDDRPKQVRREYLRNDIEKALNSHHRVIAPRHAE
jgi:hypothetical protein